MCGCKKHKIGNVMKMKGLNVERLAAVGAGAFASKALNGIAANVKFFAKKNNRWLLPTAKIAIGIFGQTQKNQMVKDAGLGFIADGGLQLVEVLAPNMFKDPWVGGHGWSRGVGVIDLRSDVSVAGYGYESGMEEMHEVGAFATDTAVGSFM